MHRNHDHHHHDHGHHHENHRHDWPNGEAEGGHAGLGHNQPHLSRAVMQWQRPHLHPGSERHDDGQHAEADLDQVEAAFIEGFAATSDPTSFLRLGSIPFEAKAADGAKLSLLRVETNFVADMGSLTPHLGGGSFRYDPLPASLVSRRRRLRFIYFDGAHLRSLSFADARSLPRTE